MDAAAPAPPRKQMPGGILLSPGVSFGAVGSYFGVIVANVFLTGSIALLLPFILTASLGVPAGERGQAMGQLAALQTAAMVTLVAFFGGLADRFPRRMLLMASLVALTLAAACFPLVKSFTAAALLCLLVGCGQAAMSSGSPALMSDYPDNASRGRFVALCFAIQGLTSALLVAQVTSRIGQVFGDGDKGAETTLGFWFAALVGLLGLAALIVSVLRTAEKPRGPTASHALVDVGRNIAKVLRFARDNRRFRAVLLLSLAFRSDYGIVAGFLTLWISKAPTTDKANLLHAAGSLQTVLWLSTIVAAFAISYLVDRFDRWRIVCAVLALAALALGCAVLIPYPTGLAGLLFVAGLGVAEGSIVVAVQSLFGQQTPPELRGSAFGLSYTLGYAFFLPVSLLSGYLFDHVSPATPFVVVAAINALVLLGTVRLLATSR